MNFSFVGTSFKMSKEADAVLEVETISKQKAVLAASCKGTVAAGSCFLFKKDAPFPIQSHLPLHSRFTKPEDHQTGAGGKVYFGRLPALHADLLTRRSGYNGSIAADMEMSAAASPTQISAAAAVDARKPPHTEREFLEKNNLHEFKDV